MSNTKNSELLPLLGTLLNNITYRIKNKRYSILGHEKYLHEVTKMCVGNPRIAKNIINLFKTQKEAYICYGTG